jgi:hypothetical protein
MREPHGVRVWFAVVGGIAAWMTHLIFEASIARRLCVTGDDWMLHAGTIVLVGVTVYAMVLALRLRSPSLATDADVASDLRFLGTMGLLIGGINVLLILFEGVMVFWVPSCG